MTLAPPIWPSTDSLCFNPSFLSTFLQFTTQSHYTSRVFSDCTQGLKPSLPSTFLKLLTSLHLSASPVKWKYKCRTHRAVVEINGIRNENRLVRGLACSKPLRKGSEHGPYAHTSSSRNSALNVLQPLVLHDLAVYLQPCPASPSSMDPGGQPPFQVSHQPHRCLHPPDVCLSHS